MFRVAHLSDLHATPARAGFPALLGKRFFGWLSWRLRRRHAHQPSVLSALLADLRREAPDHVVVTGDLTNVAGEEEFPAARAWLARIGSPAGVSIVPGNHDAYVRVPLDRGVGLWSDYIASDAAGPRDAASADAFPTLRVRGPVAVVGVNSAVPTPLFQAGGRVGVGQLQRLEALLTRLRREGFFRLLLIHHPPEAGVVSRRRELRDGPALRDVLARVGAELVLHGHMHRTRLGSLPGPVGAVPVVGARSASDIGSRPEKRAQYHVYAIEPRGGGRFGIRMSVRGYAPATGGFVVEEERSL